MNFTSFIESIPPAFYGVLIGSLLTIIGVVLTNISNTKRLKIQHEHERELRNTERDLNMRREIYMDAMEAISSGITAISRFSELNETPVTLMQSYSDLSPKVSKVTIVGNNETIEALSSFNLELNAAFLRMGAKREKFDRKLRESELIGNKIEAGSAELDRLTAQLSDSNDRDRSEIQQNISTVTQKLDQLRSDEQIVTNQYMTQMVDLVNASMAEVSSLNKQLVPLISLMRSELELPFNQAHFAETLDRGQEALEEYLREYFAEFGNEFSDDDV